MDESKEPLWDWTLRRIRQIWPLSELTELKDAINPDLPEGDLQRIREKIDACLEGRGGEVSARARAAELGEAYLVLNSVGRRRFAELLATEYDMDNEAVDALIETRGNCSDQQEMRTLNLQLRNALEPPRTRLLSQFNDLQEGVKFLVDLRAELMPWARGNQRLTELDQDVHRLLASWFDVGFLDLRRITWNTPAVLLEKLIEYEAVHAIRSWDDLKNRLADDRRCYAYFHPRMPEEPLIFVEVALVNGIATNIQELLDVEIPVADAQKADTAIFYSISNCQAGLAGVSFGNFLIKKVVGDLAKKLPNLKQFATLSPLPGFMNWLLTVDEEGIDDEESGAMIDMLRGAHRQGTLRQTLYESVDREDAAALQKSVCSLCAYYLTEVKRGKRAHDRVAHFHLSNGARIEQINWGADMSDKGIEQSGGMMVNYLYELGQIEKNHENYTLSGEITQASAVKKLVKK